jgi:hypothetical protein
MASTDDWNVHCRLDGSRRNITNRFVELLSLSVDKYGANKIIGQRKPDSHAIRIVHRGCQTKETVATQ